MTARPAPTSYGGGTGDHAPEAIAPRPGLDLSPAVSAPSEQDAAQNAQDDDRGRGSRGVRECRESGAEGSTLVSVSAAVSGDASFEDTFGTGAGADLAPTAHAARDAGAPVPGGGGGAPPAPNPAPGAGPTPARPASPATRAAAVELLARFGGEQPALARLAEVSTDPRLALLAAGWLAGFRSPRTRRAYAGDLTAFSVWCAGRGLSVLRARRVQIDLHVTGLLDAGAAASSVARRLCALSSFYGFCLSEDLGDSVVSADPTRGVRRPGIDRDHTTTTGLSRNEARALIAAADTDPGPQQLRTAALIRLLLHNALRVDEALAADLSGLTGPSGPSGSPPEPEPSGLNAVNGAGLRALTVVRKGGRRATTALAPDTAAALDRYLEARAQAAGLSLAELRATKEPLLATRTGGRLTQKDAWVLVRRLARAAGIPTADQLSPHSLRHTAITLALDAGATLRDVQDYAGHRDPRTTRRYDHHRGALERSAAFSVAGWLNPELGPG